MSQQACLPVGKLRKQLNGVTKADAFDKIDVQSMDASEYLAMVVEQSKRLPEIFSSPAESNGEAKKGRHKGEMPIDGSAASLLYLVSEKTNVAKVPSAQHLPQNTEKWVDRTLSNFSNLREKLSRYQGEGIGGKESKRQPLPSMNDRSGWHIFCVGVDEARGNEGSYFDDAASDQEAGESVDGEEESNVPEWKVNLPSVGYTPTTSLLLQMDQVLVRRVLGHVIHYVRDGWTATNTQRASWIYALLACLERPIHREDASVLFGLLKSLTQERSLVDAAKDRAKLANLNVLITIVGIYFEQGGGLEILMKS